MFIVPETYLEDEWKYSRHGKREAGTLANGGAEL
jgi:hypothetical protein